tara:strand:+ start:14279 stop:16744 length:2466 start_codon:yes stop_codon:yes gene_type:complete
MSRPIVLMLLVTILAPMFAVNAEMESRSDFVGINSQEEIIIHRSEVLEVPITLQNIQEYTQTYSLGLDYIGEDLVASGLPLQYTLNPNGLRQVKFTINCDSNAEYTTSTMKINITNDVDLEEYYIVEINIQIMPQSELEFGVSGISQFMVDPELRVNLAVNITNNALLSDDVSYSITTQSSWNWGWIMNQTSGSNAIETLIPGQLSYIYFWVEIPPVIDGAPLYETGPRFTLTATSSLDFAQSQWSFDLLMSAYRNLTIDSVGANLTLDPDDNDRLSITVRNVGNVNNKVSISLEAINELGQPITEIEIADRIEYNGWTAALFGAKENIEIPPNQSRTFEVGIQSPLEYSGFFDIRVNIYPLGDISKTYTADVGAEIIWLRDGELELVNEACLQLLPGQSCQSQFKITNTGNALDNFQFENSQIPDFLILDNSSTSYQILPNQMITTELLTLTARSDALAFKTDNAEFQLLLSGTQIVVSEVTVPIRIAPNINWTLESIIEEIDAKGRLSIAMTLRNDGNAIDGLVVQLECSHSTQMTFIPPSDAIIEDGVELPRSFEINDLPLASNFTIRAWAEIPEEQNSNGTMYLYTTIRSKFAPDQPFVFTSSVDYLGQSWREEVEEDTDFSFSKLASDIQLIVKSWGLIIIAILLSALILNRSMKDRKQRVEDAAIRKLLNQEQSPEQVEDWMDKFEQKQSDNIPKIESPSISPQKFENAFKRRSSPSKQAATPVDERLREAASLVLDVHDKSSIMETADELLEKISTEGIATPHNENRSLEMQPAETSLTTRNDPNNLFGEVPLKSDGGVNSVPLPEEIDDDLDF